MTDSHRIRALPLWLFGLEAIPGFPVQIEETIATLGRLLARADQTSQAMLGLNRSYTLNGPTSTPQRSSATCPRPAPWG
jgi:hypothetical protein